MKTLSKRLDDEGRQVLWKMWHEGKTLQEIALRLDIKRPSVFLYLQKRGGIELAVRTRSPIVLVMTSGKKYPEA